MNPKPTREQIVTAADQLFYRRGYDHTSFADVAEAVGISRGNFYHHFKAKDEILAAVIQLRLEKTRGMLEQWTREGKDPVERIRSFIHILFRNQDLIQRHGCPVGTLCTELAKLGHSAREDAAQLFTLFRAWLREQFEQLGRAADADALAMHVLARSQGVATLANAFPDDAFIAREVRSMDAWLDENAGRRGKPGRSTPARRREAR
jgi:AcrR family transcriptional regulator